MCVFTKKNKIELSEFKKEREKKRNQETDIARAVLVD